jgi:hypothetical protein
MEYQGWKIQEIKPGFNQLGIGNNDINTLADPVFDPVLTQFRLD